MFTGVLAMAWTREDDARAMGMSMLVAENGGHLNGLSMQDVNGTIERVLSRLPCKKTPFLPKGAHCFCGRQCYCASRTVIMYDTTSMPTSLSDAPMDLD